MAHQAATLTVCQPNFGVYADFTGIPKRETQVWAALLRAGPGAVVSHWTAAERHGLMDKPSAALHLTVTVIDLIEASASFEQAYDWICRAIGRRRTTPVRLQEAMAARPRMRWRRDLELVLGDAERVLSVLEHRYVWGVERPHGLPVAVRQARVWHGTGNRYLDNLYEEYRACVEIDGATAHPADEQWRDKDRDRWNAVHQKIDTIRIGVLGLRTHDAQCATAADVATWLSGRGPATGHPCTRAGCPVPPPTK